MNWSDTQTYLVFLSYQRPKCILTRGKVQGCSKSKGTVMLTRIPGFLEKALKSLASAVGASSFVLSPSLQRNVGIRGKPGIPAHIFRPRALLGCQENAFVSDTWDSLVWQLSRWETCSNKKANFKKSKVVFGFYFELSNCQTRTCNVKQLILFDVKSKDSSMKPEIDIDIEHLCRRAPHLHRCFPVNGVLDFLA